MEGLFIFLLLCSLKTALVEKGYVEPIYGDTSGFEVWVVNACDTDKWFEILDSTKTK